MMYPCKQKKVVFRAGMTCWHCEGAIILVRAKVLKKKAKKPRLCVYYHQCARCKKIYHRETLGKYNITREKNEFDREGIKKI